MVAYELDIKPEEIENFHVPNKIIGELRKSTKIKLIIMADVDETSNYNKKKRDNPLYNLLDLSTERGNIDGSINHDRDIYR